jgi:hypothetical protein
MKITTLLQQLLLLVASICLILILTGCKTTKLTTSETASKERFAETVRVKTDSIYIYRQDSVVVRIRGDTVLIDRWRLLYEYRNITDTLRLRDSVYIDRHINITETVEVNRPTGWQWFQIWCGRILLWILLAGAGYLAYGIMKKK